jgi:hypothetical protein
VPSTDGEDMRVGFELQTGLPWSGYVYQPDICSIWVVQVTAVVVPVVTAVVVPVVTAVLVPVAGAETSTERDAVS